METHHWPALALLQVRTCFAAMSPPPPRFLVTSILVLISRPFRLAAEKQSNVAIRISPRSLFAGSLDRVSRHGLRLVQQQVAVGATVYIHMFLSLAVVGIQPREWWQGVWQSRCAVYVGGCFSVSRAIRALGFCTTEFEL